NSQAVELYSSFKKLNSSEIPNVHRKLIIYNLPPTANEDEIKQYFLTLLNTLNPNMKLVNPILSYSKHLIQRHKEDQNKQSDLLEKRYCSVFPHNTYYIFELATKDDIEILKAMNNPEWRGFRMRIEKPATFIRDFNSSEGINIELKESKAREQQSL